MKNLQITETTARTLYLEASKEFKIMLEETFGKAIFLGKITDRMKTFDDIMNEWTAKGYTFLEEGEDISLLPFNPMDLVKYTGKNKEVRALAAYWKIRIINRVLNEGWIPNWKNSSEYKYYPWFDLSGSRLSDSDYDRTTSYTGVGSRLVFKTSDLAKYAGTQFLDIYEDLFVL